MRAFASRLAAAIAGLSGEELALVVTLGLVLGTFPIYGCPTVLCLVAALALRVNAPALQLVNQLSSPLQLALLVPLSRAGWHIPVASAAAIHWKLGAVALEAITGWFFICVPLGVVLYIILLLILRRGMCPWFHGCESPAR